MNRIETRIVAAVTNRLADAKESEAKSEMIEELSENLYQRYLELTESGVPEGEALSCAMESLGDVNELLAYLREEETDSQTAALGQTGGTEEGSASETDKNSAHSKSSLESGLGEIVNAAICAAKTAVDCAGDMAKDVSNQVRKKYPDGVFGQFGTEKGEKGEKADCTAIAPERVDTLDIHLINGDIRLCCIDGPDISVEISGNAEAIETVLKENNTLSIRQLNTASASFFFTRGMCRSDIEVKLPQKAWDKITASSTNGDVELSDPLECRELNVSTVNGDVRVQEITGGLLTLRSHTGDIEGHRLSGNLHAETKSGDIEVDGRADSCELSSISGDVQFRGACQEITASATSGDVDLELNTLPRFGKASAISGDCSIFVPGGCGFRLSYRTVSGDFSTDLPLTGRLGAKSGEVVYNEPVCGELQLSSTSGDIRIGTHL